MSRSLLITFKAGRCHFDDSSKPYKVTCDPTPGYIYLYTEDELVHFCWRERTSNLDDEDNIDLVMFPTDGQFEPYDSMRTSQRTAKTNGRIFSLKFTSSSQRHLFWLQSKAQGPANDPSFFSERDLTIGNIVNKLLQGEEVNIEEEVAQVGTSGGGSSGNDEDEAMEDVQDTSHHRAGSGGAGADATGGDVREEGSSARDGGADGGRAAGSGPSDAASIVQNFLNSLKGGQGILQQDQAQGQIYTTLPDLLPTSITVPMIDTTSPEQIDNLLSYLPPTLLLLAQEGASSIDGMVEPNVATAAAAMEALSIGQKKALLKRVLRSPQFHQSLGSLTMAIRDGGLPSIADALGVKLQNGGLIRGGSLPLGGGDAVEAFIEGVKKTVEKK